VRDDERSGASADCGAGEPDGDIGRYPAACAGGADEIFCNGFDPAQASTVVSGTINQPVADNADGSSFDFALQDYHAYDPSITTDDINLYDIGGMFVYWYGDVVPPAGAGLTGGVVDSGGVDFAVLHSGDKVGPSSTVSAASIAMTNWQGGADGYIGVAFWNESTSAVNYGYIHMTTQSPGRNFRRRCRTGPTTTAARRSRFRSPSPVSGVSRHRARRGLAGFTLA